MSGNKNPINNQRFQSGGNKWNHANTLLNASSSQTKFVYNGQGNRLSEIDNFITTNFTQDLAGGLTQVLYDGNKLYLYGVGRIGEMDAGGWSYYQADALGSVRQMSSMSQVTLAQSYEPYGKVLESAGIGSTNYGFTGEWTDSYIESIYLRARYYSPLTGRFITKDTWKGDYNKPASYNAWLYAYANPINLTDPSGKYPPSLCDKLPSGARELCLKMACGSDWIYLTNGDPLGRKDTLPYGGSDVKNFYDMMVDYTSGWWNKPDYDFSLEEFNGLMLEHESAGHIWAADWISKVISQRLYVGGFDSPYCPGGPSMCMNGLFNYWTTCESVRNMVNLYVRGEKHISEYYGYLYNSMPPESEAIRIMRKAYSWGSLILRPPNLNWNKNNAPSNWGNNQGWVNFISKSPDFQGMGDNENQLYYFYQDFLVYSVDQYWYWKDRGAFVPN